MFFRRQKIINYLPFLSLVKYTFSSLAVFPIVYYILSKIHKKDRAPPPHHLPYQQSVVLSSHHSLFLSAVPQHASLVILLTRFHINICSSSRRNVILVPAPNNFISTVHSSASGSAYKNFPRTPSNTPESTFT